MKTTLRFVLLMCIVLAAYGNAKSNDNMLVGLHCPADVWVNCNDELWDLSIYGNAYYVTYSGNYDAGLPVVSYDLNSCNVGTITRTWSVHLYGDDYTCSQVLHVESSGNFGPSNITWPTEHVNLTGCYPSTDPSDLPDGAQQPTFVHTECSMIAKSYNDLYFDFGSTCEKIVRTWNVIDWCQYVPNSGSNAGYYSFVQIIKISKGNIPLLECIDNVEGYSYNCFNGYVNAAPLLLGDNGCGGGYEVTNNSPYATESGNDISGTYPIGKTTVEYTVTYGCGLKKYCTVDVHVTDASQPLVYCLGQLHIPLMGMDTDGDGINDEGMLEVWAKDFDFGSQASCGNGPLSFSFVSDEVIMNKTFTCDDVGENTFNIYITDAIGNQSYCEVVLDVQNNNANIQDCEPVVVDDPSDEDDSTEIKVSGTIKDLFGQGIKKQTIRAMMATVDTVISVSTDTTTVTIYDSLLNASGNWLFFEYDETNIVTTVDTTIIHHEEEVMQTVSNKEGEYEMQEFNDGVDYMMKADIHAQYNIGEIDFSDVYTLFDHLSATQVITDAGTLIAADMDNDGRVTRDDLEILIAIAEERLSPEDLDMSWMIMTEQYLIEHSLQDIMETGSYIDHIVLHELSGTMNNQNFISIQKGNLTQYLNKNYNQQDMNGLLKQLQETPNHNPSPLRIASRNTLNVDHVGVYPNPFKDEFQISLLQSVAGYVDVSLMDLSGKAWVSKRVFMDQGHQTIQMNADVNIPSGMYLYQIRQGEQTIQGKIIKQ